MDDEARAPFIVRFGATVGIATLAALLATAPAALRLAETGELSVPRAWLTLAGLSIAPMLVLVPLARLARDGLRNAKSSGALERVVAIAVFTCSWSWMLIVFGAALREKTHHRALGAVTFAVFALVAGAFLARVAMRLAAILGALRQKRRMLGTAIAALAIGLSALVLGMRIARAAPFLSLGARAALVDGLAIALAVTFVARQTFDDRRLASRLGPPVAVFALVVAMHTLVTQSGAVTAMAHVCPVYFALLSSFSRGAI